MKESPEETWKLDEKESKQVQQSQGQAHGSSDELAEMDEYSE